MTPQPAEQNDFRAYARALWRWKWLLLSFLVVIPLIAYALEARKTLEYQSSTLVRPQAVSVDLSQFGGQSLGPQNIDALARLIKTSAVANAAAKSMKNPPANPSSLLGEISVERRPEHRLPDDHGDRSGPAARRGRGQRVRQGDHGQPGRSGQDADRRDDQEASGPAQQAAERRCGARPDPTAGAAATDPSRQPEHELGHPREGGPVGHACEPQHPAGRRARPRHRPPARLRGRRDRREQRPPRPVARRPREHDRAGAVERDPGERVRSRRGRGSPRRGGVPDAPRGVDVLQRRPAAQERRDNERRPGGRQDDRRGSPRAVGGPCRAERHPGGRRPAQAADRLADGPAYVAKASGPSSPAKRICAPPSSRFPSVRRATARSPRRESCRCSLPGRRRRTPRSF